MAGGPRSHGRVDALKAVNLGLRFALELAALTALAVWGWLATDSAPVRLLLTFAAPLLAAFAWGRYVAPKSPRRLPDPLRLLVEVVVFAAATSGLVAVDHSWLAAVLATAYVVNVVLLFVWHQRDH